MPVPSGGVAGQLLRFQKAQADKALGKLSPLPV
jgi:hypothetical protein